MPETPYDHIRTRIDRGVVVATIINGSLRGDEFCDEMKAEILDAIDKAETNKVVLDLQYVTFASSRALGVFAGLNRKVVKENGGKMALCNLSDLVQDAMAVCLFISSGNSAPLVTSKSEETAPKGKALFQVVCNNEDEAVAALAGE